MYRPYLHYDRITRRHQPKRRTLDAPASRNIFRLLDLPVELRLDIFNRLWRLKSNYECSYPACWIGSAAGCPQPSAHYTYPIALLLVNKQISEEAKDVFYSDSVFTCAIDTYDVKLGMNAVVEDQHRRREMLCFVKKAHVHVKMAGELVWNWKYPGLHQSALDYVRDSITTLCEDFAAAPALKSLTVSFTDLITLRPFYPDPDDDFEGLTIERTELPRLKSDGFEYITAGMPLFLPSGLPIVVEHVDVVNVTESEFVDSVPELEEKFEVALKRRT